MLQFLRDKSTGWFATVILGLLIVPFAIFGIDQYNVGGGSTAVARIDTPPSYWPGAPKFWPVSMLYDHAEISQDEFRSRLERERQAQREAEGEAFDAIAFDSAENKREILERMIDEKIGALSATAAGMGISDGQVQKEIMTIPAFIGADGKFDSNAYIMGLRTLSPPQTPRQFEQVIRDNLQERLLTEQLATSSFVTPKELDNLLKLSGETRDAALIAVPTVADTAAVTDAEIKTWYDTHKGQLQAPESVNLEYVIIDAAKLPPPAPVTEAQIRAQYDKDIAKYTGTETREASHILVNLPANAGKDQQDEAKRKIDAIYAEVTAAGADFAAVAKAKSEDTGSKAQGGSLGAVGKGTMPAAFDTALFSMTAAGISKPVKTDFGWHVIQLRKINASNARSFEQVKAEIAAELNKANAARNLNTVTGKVLDAVYSNPQDLKTPATANGLTVVTAGPLLRSSNEGVFATPAVKREAFKESLIKDKAVGDPIDLSPTQKMLLRVTAHQPAATLPLAKVRDEIIAQVRLERANKVAMTKANAIMAKIKAGSPVAGATAGLPMRVLNGVPRQAQGLDSKMSEAIFAIPASAKGAAAVKVFTLTNGQPMLVELRKVTPGDTSQYTPAMRNQLLQQFGMGRGIEEVRSFIRAKRSHVKVTVFDRNL